MEGRVLTVEGGERQRVCVFFRQLFGVASRGLVEVNSGVVGERQIYGVRIGFGKSPIGIVFKNKRNRRI